MRFNFSDKKILVTGGTRGIGHAIASLFYELGGVVTVTGRSEDAKEFPFKKVLVDFSNLEDTLQFATEIKNENYDILINNAGINKIDFIDEIKLEDWQKIQDVNVRAPHLLIQSVVKHMKKQKWGRIINVASVFGTVTREQRSSYTTSKAALVGMTKTAALELAPYNILVNVISPGFMDTDLTRKVLGQVGIEEILKKVPVGRLGEPKDVAQAAVFLASDANSFITGENLVIDGGFTCA